VEKYVKEKRLREIASTTKYQMFLDLLPSKIAKICTKIQQRSVQRFTGLYCKKRNNKTLQNKKSVKRND